MYSVGLQYCTYFSKVACISIYYLHVSLLSLYCLWASSVRSKDFLKEKFNKLNILNLIFKCFIFLFSFRIRVLTCVLFSLASFLVVSYSTGIWMSIIGTVRHHGTVRRLSWFWESYRSCLQVINDNEEKIGTLACTPWVVMHSKTRL